MISFKRKTWMAVTSLYDGILRQAAPQAAGQLSIEVKRTVQSRKRNNLFGMKKNATSIAFAFLITLSQTLLVIGCSSGCTSAEKVKQGEDTMTTGTAAPVVILETTKGNIEIELNADKAPISVENFLKYVDNGHYNGTIFHRVIDEFMIQGGGMTPDMNEKASGTPIKNEATNGLLNKRGTVAMARTNVVDSATAQFFINVKDNSFLDHSDKSQQGFGYCVFGEVKSGMDVVDAIKKVRTGTRPPYDDVPVEAVVIKSVRRK